MNCAVRARPTIALASSSGRMRDGSACSIAPAESKAVGEDGGEETERRMS